MKNGENETQLDQQLNSNNLDIRRGISGASQFNADVEEYLRQAIGKKKKSLIPFALESPAIMELGRHLKRGLTGSVGTAYQYVWSIEQYCQWREATPDQLVKQCLTPEGQEDYKALDLEAKRLDDYIGYLQHMGYSPGHVLNIVKAIKALFRENSCTLKPRHTPKKRTVTKDRAPRPEEIARLVDVADLRGKVIVTMMVLGGFREGTLCKLRYRHVKEDLERNIVPLHIHVEAEITKGRYCDYDTFIGKEAVDYLKAYLQMRRTGELPNKISPEQINDESPLIRDEHKKEVKPITEGQCYNILKRYLTQAGLRGTKVKGRYTMRPHTFRKYFKTQLTALRVPSDYIEYMMGHTISTYQDVESKGVEFLRDTYHNSGFSIKPQTTTQER